jgi:hypothetical protein
MTQDYSEVDHHGKNGYIFLRHKCQKSVNLAMFCALKKQDYAQFYHHEKTGSTVVGKKYKKVVELNANCQGKKSSRH